jgi:hypothetical protein
MTCEIAIMNLNAVALAADSSMTVTRWVNGQREQRYFKGSNKIFQLSSHHPVGLMVFDTASLQSVPWELIAKEFRSHLKTTSYPTLKAQAEALFDFIRGHPGLFPPERRKELFIDEAENTGLALLYAMAKRLKFEQPPANDDEKKKVIDDYLDAEINTAQGEPLPATFLAGADDKALADHQAELKAKFDALALWAQNKYKDRTIDPDKLCKLSVKMLFRRYDKLLSSTGIVIAGFGSADLYPGYQEFSVFGFVLDHFLFAEQGSEFASVGFPSVIKAFATTDMVDTFLLGFSRDVYNQVMLQYHTSIKALSEEIKQDLGGNAIPNLDQRIKDSRVAYQSAWTKAVADAHYKPLREVVASLPIDEMASLAETLVMLQSLKEKVTSPTESVGGPIDVAVITKHEGLIWINRKHYFDPEKNPRFFMRQRLQYE